MDRDGCRGKTSGRGRTRRQRDVEREHLMGLTLPLTCPPLSPSSSPCPSSLSLSHSLLGFSKVQPLNKIPPSLSSPCSSLSSLSTTLDNLPTPWKLLYMSVLHCYRGGRGVRSVVCGGRRGEGRVEGGRSRSKFRDRRSIRRSKRVVKGGKKRQQ